MAQLKDSLITGDLRVTGTIYGNATSATALKDKTNNNLTYSNYGASGLAGSSISWMTCWNGYELRAISKAETFNLVRDNGGDGRWVKKAGDTMTGELINQTGGIWVQGGSAAGSNSQRMTLTAGMPVNLAYNTSKRGTRIYSNGIAFADPYNGNSNNDAGWVRHIEETANTGILEIATGDDANEQIVIRQYNTSSAVTSELKLLDGSHNTTIPGRLTMSGGQAINQILTGTGTAASDKGSGVSPRYFPARWTFNTGRAAVDGDIYTIKIPVAGHDYGVFMSVNNGTNYYPVVANNTGRITNHYPVNNYIQVVFESAGSAASMYALNGADARATVTGGVFRVINYYDSNTDVRPASYCTTAAGTAAKTASHSAFVLKANSYTLVTMQYANSAASAITLNINGTGAKPIYINGSASSASNYTLPAGTYVVFYNGTNYYFRTDAGIQGGTWFGNASSATNIYSSASTAKAYVLGTTTASSANHATVYNASVYTQNSVLFGAAWNDYAEFRKTAEAKPGQCVREVGDGSLVLTTKRLEKGCEIVSDTYGFAIGETDEYKTPIAATGRVLAYPYEDIEEFKTHIGNPVCSGPNGTVSIMTEEEEEKYPSRIIGTISEIPTYETWGTGNVEVNGRVWIRIR